MCGGWVDVVIAVERESLRRKHRRRELRVRKALSGLGRVCGRPSPTQPTALETCSHHDPLIIPQTVIVCVWCRCLTMLHEASLYCCSRFSFVDSSLHLSARCPPMDGTGPGVPGPLVIMHKVANLHTLGE